MLSLDLYLKLRKVICARIAECERNKARQPKAKHWDRELADCDGLMRWLDTETPEITRLKEVKPSELIAEILASQLGVTL